MSENPNWYLNITPAKYKKLSNEQKAEFHNMVRTLDNQDILKTVYLGDKK